MRNALAFLLFVLGLIVGMNLSHFRTALQGEKANPQVAQTAAQCPECPALRWVGEAKCNCKRDCPECMKNDPGVFNEWGDVDKVIQMSERVFRYESPVQPSRKTIDQRKEKYAVLPKSAIDFGAKDAQFLKLAEKLAPFVKECETHGGFVPNYMIFWDDFSIAYAMVRLIKPMRVIEVGSGHSTSAVFHARRLNKVTNSTQVCIEPFRSSVIDEELAGDLQIIPTVIQDVYPEIYKELQANDILYLDSSHVFQPFGDTILELNFILPELNPGVIVHIHDIFIPFNYPDAWIYQRPYTETWALALFLLNNSEWEVIFPNYYMLRVHKDRMKSLGFLSRGSEYTKEAGELDSAIWLRRKIPGETKSPFA